MSGLVRYSKLNGGYTYTPPTRMIFYSTPWVRSAAACVAPSCEDSIGKVSVSGGKSGVSETGDFPRRYGECATVVGRADEGDLDDEGVLSRRQDNLKLDVLAPDGGDLDQRRVRGE